MRVALDDTAAYQVEKLRSQVLADLDRAKMEFFQNVSHELRTPLTAPEDRTMWATIVSNLLANAVKYTRHGRIEVTLTVTDTDVRLTVTDTGRGIDPAEQALVFDRDSWRNRWTTWKDKRPWTTAGRQRSTLSARSIGESGNVSITQKLCGDASGGRQAEPPAPPHQRVLLRWRVSWPRLAIGRCVAAVDTWKGPGTDGHRVVSRWAGQ